MKYSFKHIFATRKTLGTSQTRILENKFIPINRIGKLLSPYPTWFYLNLGLKPDHVTFISFVFIIGSAYFFILGNTFLASISLLLFAIHDSVDGDMARVSGGTSYGALIDSFGADIFYSLIPVSVGYYLYSIGIAVGSISPSYVLLMSAFTSLSFLFYRLMNTKILSFFWDKGGKGKTSIFNDTEETVSQTGSLVRLAKLYRHPLVRGNFFAEPGIITWITVLVFFEKWEWLGAYLVLILLYNLGYLVPNFIRIYFSFLKYEKETNRARISENNRN